MRRAGTGSRRKFSLFLKFCLNGKKRNKGGEMRGRICPLSKRHFNLTKFNFYVIENLGIIKIFKKEVHMDLNFFLESASPEECRALLEELHRLDKRIRAIEAKLEVVVPITGAIIRRRILPSKPPKDDA